MSEVEYLKLQELRKKKDAIIKEREERIKNILQAFQRVGQKLFAKLKEYGLFMYSPDLKSDVFESKFKDNGELDIVWFNPKSQKAGIYGKQEKWDNYLFRPEIHLDYDLFAEFIMDLATFLHIAENTVEEYITKLLKDAIFKETNYIATMSPH